MNSQSWIYAAAGYNVALAAFHLGFWRLFRWKDELPKLHPLNRGVVQVMNAMLILLFLTAALVQVRFAPELTGTALGRTVLGGMGAFWLVRAILQPVFFPDPPAVRWGFCVIFLLGAGLHALAFPRE